MPTNPQALDELWELIPDDRLDDYTDWINRWLVRLDADNSVAPEDADVIVGSPLKQRMIAGAKHKIATVLHKQDGIFHVTDEFPRMEVAILMLRAMPFDQGAT